MLFCRYGPEGFHAAGESMSSSMRPLLGPADDAGLRRGGSAGRFDLAHEGMAEALARRRAGEDRLASGATTASTRAELGNPVPAEPLLFLKSPGVARRPPGADRAAARERAGRVRRRDRGRGRRPAAPRLADRRRARRAGRHRRLRRHRARPAEAGRPTFARAKSFDSFCPLGPAVLRRRRSSSGLELVTRVNGVERQRGPRPKCRSGSSSCSSTPRGMMTLEPGDVFLTGTPAGVGPLADGDRRRSRNPRRRRAREPGRSLAPGLAAQKR